MTAQEYLAERARDAWAVLHSVPANLGQDALHRHDREYDEATGVGTRDGLSEDMGTISQLLRPEGRDLVWSPERQSFDQAKLYLLTHKERDMIVYALETAGMPKRPDEFHAHDWETTSVIDTGHQPPRRQWTCKSCDEREWGVGDDPPPYDGRAPYNEREDGDAFAALAQKLSA